MKKYALPLILIILGVIGFIFGSKREAGINPIKGVIKYGGILLVIVGVIMIMVKAGKA